MDSTVATVDRKARLAALMAQAEAEEAAADAAVTPEDAEEAAAVERIEAARRRKEEALAGVRRAALAQQTERLRKVAATANPSYVVEPFDANETAPGAGCFVVRSVSPKVWQTFTEAVGQAGESAEKVQRAYLNLADACILWTDVPDGDEAWTAHRAKYPVLVQSIGDMCGRLGGVAAQARKR